jgi:hypothetical protein
VLETIEKPTERQMRAYARKERAYERANDRYDRSVNASILANERHYNRSLWWDRHERALRDREAHPKTCGICTSPLKGKGSNHALYCIDCWLEYGVKPYHRGIPVWDIVAWNFPLITEKAFHRKLYKWRRTFREKQNWEAASFLARR